MRKLLFTLAVCTAFSASTSAQPASRSVIFLGQGGDFPSQDRGEGWSPLAASLHADGFGMQLPSDLAERSGDALVGRMVLQSWTGAAWEDEVRYAYTYDGEDLLIQMLQQAYNNAAWVDRNRVIFTYAGALLSEEVLQRQEGGGAWMNLSRVSYAYTNEDLTERIEQVWGGADWENGARILIAVDADGKRTDALSQVWNAGAWENDERYSFTYVAGSIDIAEIRSDVWSGSAWVSASREVWSYEDELLAEVLGQDWEGGSWVNEYLRTYTYTNGDLAGTLSQRWDGTAWEDAGQLLYTYDADGNRTVIVEQNFADAQWVNSSRTLFEYRGTTASEQDAAPSTLALSVYPNPAAGAATLGFELEQGGAVSWSAYDVTGRRVAGESERTLRAGAHAVRWEVADLPSGVYVVQLRTERVVTTQRLVVVK